MIEKSDKHAESGFHFISRGGKAKNNLRILARRTENGNTIAFWGYVTSIITYGLSIYIGFSFIFLLRIFRPVSFLLSPRSLQFLEFDSILVLYFPIFWPSHPPPSDSREEKSRRITRGKNERGINIRHHMVFN